LPIDLSVNSEEKTPNESVPKSEKVLVRRDFGMPQLSRRHNLEHNSKQNLEQSQQVRRVTAPKVLVVDGDLAYAEFVIGALRRGGFVGHHVASGEHAVEAAVALRPAAVILDVILPGTTGYEICRDLRQRYGEQLPIVFVSGERREAADRVVGLLIGADDYLVKPVDAEELITRLRRLIMKSWGSHPPAPAPPPAFGGLTTRENEVLRLLARGLDQGTIAQELAISPATVGTHIQRILNKLDVHSRTQAVALAYREKLVDQT
jgi:DNA-binding NarL/FixJ family response regulator